MVKRWMMPAIAIAAVGALAVGAGTSAAKPKKAKKVNCSYTLQTQGNPTDLTGSDFGFVKCNKKFGKGVQYDTFTTTPTSQTAGSVTGAVTDYFDKGTARGTFDLTYTATSPTALTYTGTFKITGGTGAFRKVRGTGALACSSADGGVHTTCTSTGKYTGI
jgi:hypothetical protein